MMEQKSAEMKEFLFLTSSWERAKERFWLKW